MAQIPPAPATRNPPAGLASSWVPPVIRAMSRANVWLFQRSRGRLGATWLHGTRVCLLTTRGRKSGQERTVPVLYMQDGQRLVVVASKGGRKEHPLWYLNLSADPAVRVQIGAETRDYVARTASDEERKALWPSLSAMYPDYDNYQSWSPRVIPVVILEPK